MQMLQDQSWAAMAACATTSPDDLFVQGAAQRSARAVCFGCPVRLLCLADALDNRVPFGVWGGMTERERRALLRRQPDVTSWRNLLSSGDESVAELVAIKPPRGGRTTAVGRPALRPGAARPAAPARTPEAPGSSGRN
jgi:WhiB family redox-sensing transcriptional regulator